MGKARKVVPAEQVDPGTAPYVYKQLKAPVLQGFRAQAFLSIYESAAGHQIFKVLSPSSGVHEVLHELVLPEAPQFQPYLPHSTAEESACVVLNGSTPVEAVAALTQQGIIPELPAAAAVSSGTDAADASEAGFNRPTISDYVQAYRSGQVTPTQVAERIIEYIGLANNQHGWFIDGLSSDEHIREQAAASTARWASGAPLSLLDGVPYALKDMWHAEPYNKTTNGSTFAARWPASGNADCVKAMASLGAVLLGKTTMHEIGLGVTGLNVRTGTALNPHNPAHHTGGSSSGSGAVVAAGLCPIAIGGDGGGSIRIPSSFCGIVGLKPTTDRISAHGGFMSDHTVAAMGPMAASVQDALIMYVALANEGAGSTPREQPIPSLRVPKLLDFSQPKPLTGCKAGIYWSWFKDAHPDVVESCSAAVKLLETFGLAIQDVTIPELEWLRVAHNVTIASEMMSVYQHVWEDPKGRAQMNLDVRLALQTARFLTASDYVQAQRIRRRATVHFQRAMKDVDVLIVPSTPCTAPAIPPGALKSGNSDLGQASLIMRFVLPANLLGLPAMSVPVGVDSKGLPVGLQIIGKPWCEATVLRYAAVLETAVQGKLGDWEAAAAIKPMPAPRVWVNPLTGQTQGV